MTSAIEAGQTLATGEINYTYAGDGKMVKSVVNGAVTYYVNQYYEIQVGGSADKEIKYYYAGASRIAERENGTLTWIITDQLGSTTALANEDGTLKTLLRYTAFGELRAAYSNDQETPTDYRYTGQRAEVESGLYYYVARFREVCAPEQVG